MIRYEPLSHANLDAAYNVVNKTFCGENDKFALGEFPVSIETGGTPVQIYVGIDESGRAVCIGGLLAYSISLDSFSVVWVAVLPELQGQGLGKGMVRFLETAVKLKIQGLSGSLILSSDEKESSFYEKLGFIKQGMLHNNLNIMVKVVNKKTQ